MKKPAFALAIICLLFALALPAHAQARSEGARQNQGTVQQSGAPRTKAGAKKAQRRRGPAKRPAGWDKGRKEGWNDDPVPPSEARRRSAQLLPIPMSPNNSPAPAASGTAGQRRPIRTNRP